MKNRLVLSLLLMLTWGLAHNAQAQFSINFSSDNVPVNGRAEIDVSVSGFNNIIATDYSVNWDAQMFNFVEITNLTTDLPDFGAGSIGNPSGAGVEEGQITVSWNESGTNPQSIPDGTRLFTLVLDAVGNECDISEITLSNTPRPIEIVDENLNIIQNVASTPGEAMIDGPDCNGTGGDKIGFSGSMETAASGNNVCVEVSVQNFADIQSLQSGITWDPAVLSFTGVQSFTGLDGLNANAFNVSNAANGDVRFLWTDPTADNPVTLDDGFVVFEICFDAIGSDGSMSDVAFEQVGNFGVEFSDSNGSSLDFENFSGNVDVMQQGGGGDFTLEGEMIEAGQGTIGCVTISTSNFDDISSMQFTLSWDPAVVTFNSVSNFGLDGLTGSSFNLESSDKLRLTWNSFDGSGVNMPDDTELFDVCFNVIGDCAASPSTNVNFINDGNFEIEIARGSTQMPISPLNLISGSLDVAACGVNYQVVSITSPDCAGEAGGSIAITVDGSDDNCNCIWEDAQGNQVSSGTIGANDCNLLGVVAGTYTFKIDCPGQGNIFTKEETISEPAAINIGAAVTNAACGEGGSINLTVSGGAGGTYTYGWDPDQGNNEDIENLSTGNYNVTVTDANGCTATSTFAITEEASDLVLTASDVMDASCFGEADGAISLVVDGGCKDGNNEYNFSWQDGNGNAVTGGSELVDIVGGAYSVTITDSGSPAQTIMQTFTVDQPGEIMVSVASITPSENGNDGQIELSVSGGAGSYMYQWSPDQGNTDSPGNLAPGDYSVTVTDANGCTSALENINVASGGPSMANVVATDVECNGESNGAITGSVTGGSLPVMLSLSGPMTSSQTLNELGTFNFDGLPAGDYKIIATDNDNLSVEIDLTVNEPEAITVVAVVTPESESGGSDGAIDLTVAGGTPQYTYQWSNGATSEDLNNLSSGNYNVIITDSRGCEFMDSHTVIPPTGCLKGISVITPNGDGANDVFMISCVSDFETTLAVFDRIGARVLLQDNYDGQWGGTDNNGNLLPEGAYMWVLEVDFGSGQRELITGTVTLLRDF